MSLKPGRTIGHYQVLSKIGAGGMGEVWRASDLKLGRDVALKVLPAPFSGETERMQRFQREAQVLASLNHPNIAAIHGIEQIEGMTFLVLELVEGPDLAEQLARGPLPLDQALDVARQMADALEAAHERGIVHRDLKPANVKRTPEGKVKILDFGLAKALAADDGGRVDPSLSPTITSLSTKAGVILGSAAYMSPEQARGGPVDRRADVWAFGCILLELLTGVSPFHEATVSDTVASILRSEPDWDKLPSETPAAVRHLLRRCLTKDPRKRLRDIGEARVALEDPATAAEAPPAAVTSPPAAARRRTELVLAVALTALATVLLTRALRAPAAEPRPRRFEAVAGSFVPSSAVLAPDGAKVAFVREDRLWLRFLDRLDPVPLEGTEGASHVAWSPDGQSLLYLAHGDLLSVPVGGGTPLTVALGIGELGDVGGIAVQGDRVLLASGDGGIRELSTRGGEPRDLVVPNASTEADLHEPTFLPDGSVLLVVHRVPEGPDTIGVYRDGRIKYVIRTGGQNVRGPVYSPTGHILYHRSGAKAGLWAAPFSLDDLEITGDSLLITTNGTFPSVAADGTLLYVRNAGEGGVRSQLVWVERDGRVGPPLGPEMDGICAPALSPDGKRVAIMRPETEPGNIWIFDVDSGARSRLTFGSPADWDPAWTPDGLDIIFWQGSTRALARIRADGSGRAERMIQQDLLDSGNETLSADGRWMAFWARTGPLEQDIMVLDLERDAAPVPLIATPAIEHYPHISPDGSYLAYTSNESGRSEVYLTRFPSGEGKWQVSFQGGVLPLWSPVGDELFFLSGTALQSVKVTLGPAPRIGEAARLFDAVEAGVNVGYNQRYEVSRDGKRFLMIKDRQNEGAPPGIVIDDGWLAAVRAP